MSNEVPQFESQQFESPHIEASQAEASQAEASQAEASQVEAPQVEAPQVEAPQVEAPHQNDTVVLFEFMRHLLSCNNVDAGKAFGKDFEPSASAYGVIKTIEFAIDKNKESNFIPNNIFVSNLLRTWITAFLVNGSNGKQILTLNIAPYLKEADNMVSSRGNSPKPIKHTINKFMYFLNNLKEYLIEVKSLRTDDTEWVNTVDNWYNNLSDEIIFTLPTKKYSLENSGTINTLTKMKLKMNHVKNPLTSMKNMYSNSKNNQQTQDEIIDGNGYQQIIIKREVNNGSYVINNNLLCKIYDTVGPSSNDGRYLNIGNLKLFMEWYLKKYPNNNDKVFVVTHSQIMQKYLKNLGYDIAIENPQARNSNLWRFTTNLNATANDISRITDTIVPGVSNKGEAESIAETMQTKFNNNNSGLCGSIGSVKPYDFIFIL